MTRLLQWGRDRQVADSGVQLATAKNTRGFNGAATVRSRIGGAEAIWASCDPDVRFNGAATVRSRIGVGHRASVEGSRLDRFNGAATVRSRIANTTSWHQGTTFTTLQWGRDRQVADSVPTWKSAAWLCGRFNGAATVRSRIVVVAGVTAWLRTIESLQWGRDRQVADRSCQGQRLSSRPPASMGPRPSGRG